MDAVLEQRRAGGDDDEAGDQVGEDRAGDRLAFLVGQVLLARAALDHRRLQVQLHVGGDRRAGGRDHQQQVGRAGLDFRRDDRLAHFAPVGMGEDRRDRVGEEGIVSQMNVRSAER